MHEELVDRCNKVGCRVSDFLKAAIEFALYDHVEFDFGNEDEDLDESQKSKNGDPPRVHYIEPKEKCSWQESIPSVKVRLD